MNKYLQLTSHLIDEFDDVKLKLIPREENPAADKVARLALAKDAPTTIGLLMEVHTIPSIDKLQTLAVQKPSNWMEPIISYIKDGQLPSNSSKSEQQGLLF